MRSTSLVTAFDSIVLPVLALAGAVLLFGSFVWLGGTSPIDTWALLVNRNEASAESPCAAEAGLS